MDLPEDDELYLQEKGFIFEIVPDGSGGLLLLKDYKIDTTRYEPAVTTLMVRIPAQYPNAKLDMFYADPPIKLKENGHYPDRADHFENHAGRKWQRFSRHLPDWRPGLDGLPTLLTFVQRELQGGT